MSDQTAYDPTEKTIYEEPLDNSTGLWDARLFVCGPLPKQGIGINVGGSVHVKPLKEWHRLAERESELAKLREENQSVMSEYNRLMTETEMQNDVIHSLQDENERYRKALERLYQDLDDQACEEQPIACSLRDIAKAALEGTKDK